MKTVIAPIDFSEVSKNALWFAGEICKRTAARLIVVNVMNDGDDREAIHREIKQAISNLQNFIGSEVQADAAMVSGNFVSSLTELIGEYQPDLMVMGTKGASGLKRILIGSNTVQILANVQIPVLVIPEVARFKNFLKVGRNRVVLATDLHELKDESALDILKELALLIEEPKLRVISVRPENTDIDDSKRMERSALVSHFRPEVPTEWYTIFSKSVLGGIKYYLDKNRDTGLVAMIARDTGQLIQKHFTREMASHTEYPLLVMNEGDPG